MSGSMQEEEEEKKKKDKHKLVTVYLLPSYLSRICVNEGNTPFLTIESANERKKGRTHVV